MKRSRTAFCPGHVTAFFEICDQPSEFLKKGSRGAGLCLSLGARSEVTARDSDSQSISVKLNGIESDANVTKDAVQYLIREGRLEVTIETSLDLPIEQGFGMSAAGALSSSLALCDIIGIDSWKAFEAAHVAELMNQTGLGDVSGISAGGAEVRIAPGLPPFGKVDSLDLSSEVVLAVVGKPMKTPDILSNPARRKKIIDAGRRCMEEYLQNMTLEHMFALGMEFVEEAELSSKPVLDALMSLDENDMGSMVMLGNSIFAIGDSNRMVESLKGHGKIYKCSIDRTGPRML